MPQKDSSEKAVRSTAWEALCVTVLSSFAVAAPLFDVLARNAAFLAARRLSPGEIVALALGLVVLLPLPALVALALVGRRVQGRQSRCRICAGSCSLLTRRI